MAADEQACDQGLRREGDRQGLFGEEDDEDRGPSLRRAKAQQGSLTQALGDLKPLRSVKAAYLCFFMIPVEERIGEWRFAGTATNLADAFKKLDSYTVAMGFEPEGIACLFEGDVLEIGSPENVWGDHPGATFQDEWEEALPANHVITFAKGGAPYDDIGFAILEVASLGSYAGRKPDTRRPDDWEGEEDED